MKIETHAQYLARLERERAERMAYWLGQLDKLRAAAK